MPSIPPTPNHRYHTWEVDTLSESQTRDHEDLLDMITNINPVDTGFWNNSTETSRPFSEEDFNRSMESLYNSTRVPDGLQQIPGRLQPVRLPLIRQFREISWMRTFDTESELFVFTFDYPGRTLCHQRTTTISRSELQTTQSLEELRKQKEKQCRLEVMIYLLSQPLCSAHRIELETIKTHFEQGFSLTEVLNLW